MDLHANAALSLNKRRQLCRRVIEEQWTLTKAAAAAPRSPVWTVVSVGHSPPRECRRYR